jgi:hypothetical protein
VIKRAEGQGGSHGSSKVAVDSNAIPANMMSLFQQFLASMGHREEEGKAKEQEKNDEKGKQPSASEKEKIEMEVQKKELAETSTQGAARGTSQNGGLYCYHCLSRGHPKEEYFVTLFCKICESASHVKGQCLLCKK